MPEANNHHVNGPLAEFSCLRTEIIQAKQMQWNSLALQLTATGVVFSYALSGGSRAGFLLILPVVSYVLGSHYTGSYLDMQRIATYIMEELSPKVPGGLKWEEWRRHYAKTSRYPTGWRVYIPPSIAFPAISLVALVWTISYILHGSHLSSWTRSVLVIIWVMDLIITAISLFSMSQTQKHYGTRDLGLRVKLWPSLRAHREDQGNGTHDASDDARL